MQDFPIVILAAGGSTRLGRPKQLVEVGSETLIKRAVRTAFEAGGDPVWVVLGSTVDLISESLAGTQARVLFNPKWQQGISTSIRVGLSALAEETDRVLMMLCDQPNIPSGHLRGLIDAQIRTGAKIAATAYRGGGGVPCVFARSMFSSLATLEGDQGARDLIRTSTSLELLSLGSDPFDIDTPDDLNRWQAR